MITTIYHVTKSMANVGSVVTPCNMCITVKLDDVWATIEEQASQYTGNVCLYVRATYGIPIIDKEGNAIMNSSTVYGEISYEQAVSTKEVILFMGFEGTYDESRRPYQQGTATVWVYENKLSNS